MQKLTFITSHPKKAEELSWHLSFPVTHKQLDLPEIQSLDPHEVVSVKAREAYKRLKHPVLVEDFSIRFEALGKLPGPFIKWFLVELGVEGLCKLLGGHANRTALVQTCFALCDKSGVHVFDGTLKGIIAAEPRGKNSFGTDVIFMPQGWQKTWGEMNKEEQVASSVRRIGLKKLEAYLTTTWESNSNLQGRNGRKVPEE
jgi:non-canonical purine NTP pyrophosphatase (RdgB/HAM1 family)